MANSKDYYRMRYGQAGMDPTDNGEPQSVFDARATDFGADDDTKVTTVKEDKKGTTKTEVKTKGSGEKLTLSSFFPTIVPSEEERMAAELANRDILSGNKPRGVVMGEGGYANADNTMTMPVTPFGEKSASGNAQLSDAGIFAIAKDFEAKRELRLANQKEANRINSMEKAMAPLSGQAVREARDIPWWARMEDNASNGYGRGLDHTAAYLQLEKEAQSRAEDAKEKEEKINAMWDRKNIAEETTDLFKDSPQFNPDDIESYPRGIEGKVNPNEFVNPDGSVDREKIDAMWDRKNIEEDEEAVVTVPAARKSIEMLEKELKALENDPKLRRKKYLDFLRENGVLKEWRPDLFKALAGSAFRLLMGDRAGDAFTYSFGRMQEQKDIAAEAKAKKDAADAKAKASAGNDIEYSKDAKVINIGTAQNPIEVRTTTGKSDGIGYFSYQGQNIKLSALKNPKSREILGLGPLNANLPTGYSESFSTAETNDAITKNVGVLSGLLKEAIGYDDVDDKDKAFYDSGMLAESQLYTAINMLKESGVDVGPNMNPVFMASLQESAINFLKHREINPKSTKQYTSFVKDDIIVADMRGIGLGQETYIAPQFIPGTKDEFEMNESSFSEVISNANTFVVAHARKSGDARVEALVTGISRNKIGFAHAMYEEWLKDPKNASEQGKKNVAAKNMAGYEAGYLPFHYWLRTQTR